MDKFLEILETVLVLLLIVGALLFLFGGSFEEIVGKLGMTLPKEWPHWNLPWK